jgi:hypothetical protein
VGGGWEGGQKIKFGEVQIAIAKGWGKKMKENNYINLNI